MSDIVVPKNLQAKGLGQMYHNKAANIVITTKFRKGQEVKSYRGVHAFLQVYSSGAVLK